jgi:hypothetical protein
MLILGGLGLAHARRTDPGTDILTRPAHGTRSVATPVRVAPNGSQPPPDDLIGTAPGTPAAGSH